MNRLPAALGAALATLLLAAAAAPAHAAVSLLQVGTFDQPVHVTAAPGDASRVYVVQRGGRIMVVRAGHSTTFLDLGARVRISDGELGWEQGLYSAAFPPDYATSGKFYVYYTAPPAGPAAAGGVDVVVAEVRRTDADHADPASVREILRIPHRLDAYENGGQLAFGPDGKLYVGTGDGGGEDDAHANAQRLDPATDDAGAGRDALLGKILRIDPTPGDGCGGACTVPAGNPGFPQREVWAFGLRNPWRFSFDRATGDLIIGDVGQHSWEEVDFAPAGPAGAGAGLNFGWSTFEATHPNPTGEPLAPGSTPTAPVLERTHGAPDGFQAITGGFVVRDPALPSLYGHYLYSDVFDGDIQQAQLSALSAQELPPTGLHVDGGLVSFGEDACGRIYAVTQTGPVYRLVEGADRCASSDGGSAGGGSGSGGSGGSGGSTPALVSGPQLSLRVAARQRALRTGRLSIGARCTVACRVRVRAAITIARGRVARTGTTSASVRAGALRSVRLKLSARVRRSVRSALRHHRVVRVRFTVTAIDGQGRRQSATAGSRIVG